MVLSDKEIATTVTVQRVFAAITFVASLFLIGAIILFQKYRFPSSRLVLWLSVAINLQAIIYLIPFSQEDNAACDFQAFAMSFFDWSVSLWVCIIAFNLYQVVIKKKETTSWEKWYHAVVWGVALIFAVVPFFGGDHIYGDAGAWCWILSNQQSWRIGTWYGPLFIMFGYIIIMYVLILRTLYSQRSSEFYQREMDEELEERWRTSMRLSRYPLIFVVLWIFPMINRIYNMATGDEVFWMSLLHGVCIALQGTINSVIYCIDEDVLRSCTPKGVKAALINLATNREKHQVQKYTLHMDEGHQSSDEEGKKGKDLEDYNNDMENIAL